METVNKTLELVHLSGRSIQDSVRTALHRVAAAVPGPLPESAGGPSQWEEDSAVLPRGPAHCTPAGILGGRPAENQNGHLPAEVQQITDFCAWKPSLGFV